MWFGKRRLGLLVLVQSLVLAATVWGQSRATGGSEWQWSVPDGKARAYLWIPPTCTHVRAVVLANHNMIEQGILEHPTMRRTLSELNMAEIWVVPYFDQTFDFNKGAAEHFETLMAALAEESGYSELRFAPVVPLGHSACATYPWNFAAWNPGRTLALLSVHGDAPQTKLTGNGRPRIAWGDHHIDGVPSLMVMGEFEWWEDRLTPAFEYLAAHPRTPMALLADAGHGHFDYSDRTVAFLAMFIRKAAAVRLPAAETPLDQPVPLSPVLPEQGWRNDRWHPNQPPGAPAAPWAAYTGDANHAFWCFDEEMARETEAIYAHSRGKKPQLLSVTELTAPPQSGCGEPVTPRFVPEADGLTFRLQTAFMDVVPGSPAKNGNPARWAGLPAGSPLGHATGGGPIVLSWIVGPAVQTGPDSFMVRYGRAEYPSNGRNRDVWLLASHPGDEQYRSAVQQVQVRLPAAKEGPEQHLSFPAIPDQPAGVRTLKLAATSDAGVPVQYYLREGPAKVQGDTLVFTPIPPRAKYPIKITVVAWQFGRIADPKLKAAAPVEQTFQIVGQAIEPGK